jgi:hypothetical protein
MEQNADHSVIVSAAARRGQQRTSLLIQLIAPRNVSRLLCLKLSLCVCNKQCSPPRWRRLQECCMRLLSGCIVAAGLPNEEHATRVLSIIANVGVAMTRRLTSSCVVHMAAPCLLCSTVPWSLGRLPQPYWMCLVTCLACLRTLNMVTNPLYYAFKCMHAGARGSLVSSTHCAADCCMDTSVGQQKPPVTSKPTDLRQLAFRMQGSDCGGGSTARLYVNPAISLHFHRQTCCWLVCCFSSCPPIVVHRRGGTFCRRCSHCTSSSMPHSTPRRVYYWLCHFHCFTASTAALCTSAAGGWYCWQSFCTHIAQRTFATHGAVTSMNCMIALEIHCWHY